jgi:hypothetical protein
MQLNFSCKRQLQNPKFLVVIIPYVPPTKMKPNSSKKPSIAFVSRHLKCKAIILDDDTLENLKELDITIGQSNVENLQQRRLVS